MKKLIVFLLVIILIPVALLAYLGVVPGLSKIVAGPVDLGVKSDPSYTPSLEQKLNFKNELPNGVVPAGAEAVFSGTMQVDETVTSEAATSILAHWKKRNHNFPVRDVQVRFNPDATAEVSGILEISTAVSIAKTLGYSDADIEKGKSYVKYVANDLPFYVKGTTQITDNQISINPSSFQLGKVTIPENITTPTARVVEDVIERKLKQIVGVDLKSVKLGSSSLRFTGTVPNTIR